MKFVENWCKKYISTERPDHKETPAEQVARYQAQRNRATRIRGICYAIGGQGAMSVWEERNCPKRKRWLWRICNDAQTVIGNTYLDMQTVMAGNPNHYNLP